jgi:hypothetical protein
VDLHRYAICPHLERLKGLAIYSVSVSHLERFSIGNNILKWKILVFHPFTCVVEVSFSQTGTYSYKCNLSEAFTAQHLPGCYNRKQTDV